MMYSKNTSDQNLHGCNHQHLANRQFYQTSTSKILLQVHACVSFQASATT